uniref:Large ribosomal subunit protein mL62 n=1 Tax=Angiostrongylus cantonensis TaxID=6313 RepID=A0A0K0DEA7_ANGCA
MLSVTCDAGTACCSSTTKFNGIIPTEAVEKRYMLSSGPGGQNVQKNATKLIIESDRTRERHLNLADCFDKLRSTIYDVEKNMNSRVQTEEDTAIIRQVRTVSSHIFC